MRRVEWAFLASAAAATAFASSAGCGQAFTEAPSDAGMGGKDSGESDTPAAGDENVEIEASADTGGSGGHDSGHPCSTHLDSDTNNCGACGHVCVTGNCAQGFCEMTSTPITNVTALVAAPTSTASGNVFVGTCSSAGRGEVSLFPPSNSGASQIIGDLSCADGVGPWLAVNSTSLYWASASSTISSTSTSSPAVTPTPVSPLSAAVTNSIVAIAADDEYLFAALRSGDLYSIQSPGNWSAVGSNKNSVLSGLAVGPGHVAYWSDQCHSTSTITCVAGTETGGIFSAIPGDTTTIGPIDTSGPSAIAVGALVYWLDSTSTIQTATTTLTGTSPITAPSRPVGLAAASDGSVAWTDASGDVWLRRPDMVRVHLAAAQNGATFIAFNDNRIYWVTPTGVSWTWR